jgi:hypothetical protein
MTAYEHQAVDHNASIRAERPDPDQVQVTITHGEEEPASITMWAEDFEAMANGVRAPTPRPHAERAPEGEVTAAVRRGAERMAGTYLLPKPSDAELIHKTRVTLDSALDVEEMARVLHREGAWCGVCEYDGWDACTECRETVTGYATALRTAILGGAA